MIATRDTQESKERTDSLDTATDTRNRFTTGSSTLKPLSIASSERMTTVTSPSVKPKRNRSQTINPPPSGRFHVAKTLDEVVNAWSLTYNVYAANDFIDSNDHKLHTIPQAISPNTAVFYSTSGSKVDGTLTAILDGPDGLPLDTVYKKELDALRRKGRRLSEHSMFAHMTQIAGPQAATHLGNNGSQEISPRQQADHARTSLIHLMCRTVFYSLAMNCTDIVVGVHPKHARFYKRAWGAQQVGNEQTYPTVNNRPVVLIRLDFSEVLRRAEQPYAFDFLLNNPIPLDTFQERYKFAPSDYTNSSQPLHAYLCDKYPAWEERFVSWYTQQKVG